MSQKKKLVVLQVLPRLHMGGVERGTVDVACFLQKKGHTSMVTSAGGKLVRTLEKEGVKHFLLPVHKKSPMALYHNMKALCAIIKEYKVDIIHARSRAPAWSAYWASKRMGIPFVTTFHGAYNFKGCLKKKYNAVMTYGKKVIAPSKFIKDHIEENYKAAKCGAIVQISRGVDLDVFDPEKVDEGRLSRLMRVFQLPEDKKIILLPGRITRLKGHKLLLEALLTLKDRKDFACVLLGSASEKNQPYLEELLSFVEENKLGSRVCILEDNDDMPAVYKLAHVTVSPSIYKESFGRVIAEAGAMGCPVIASNHGGAQEIVEHGKTGWLFPPGDLAALTECLKEVLDMKILDYKKLSEYSISYVRKNFNNQDMLKKTLKVYQSLAEKK